jgi:hypothetical protein
MKAKKPQQSRMIILNAALALVQAVVLVCMDYLPQLEAYLSPRTFLILQIGVNVVNVFMRMITHLPISVSDLPAPRPRKPSTKSKVS